MAAMPDLPPSHHQQERIVCSITAAEKYAVPANILLAIAEKEKLFHPRAFLQPEGMVAEKFSRHSDQGDVAV